MSDSPSYEPERRKPSYGLPGTPATDSDPKPPVYGQPSANAPQQPGSTPPAVNSATPHDGTHAAGSAPAQSNWGSQERWEPQNQPTGQPAAPFGGYGSAPQQTQHVSAPKKQKPVGIVLTVLGALGMLLAIALAVVGLWQGIGSVVDTLDAPTSTNSTLSGTTATYEFTAKSNSMYMIYVPDQDKDVTCTGTYSDGSSAIVQPNTEDSQTFDIGGKPYRIHSEAIVMEDAGTGTIECENVSAPVVVAGPIEIFSVIGWIAAAVIGGLVLGGIGFILFIAGIITMIVRASNRQKAQAA